NRTFNLPLGEARDSAQAENNQNRSYHCLVRKAKSFNGIIISDSQEMTTAVDYDLSNSTDLPFYSQPRSALRHRSERRFSVVDQNQSIARIVSAALNIHGIKV